MVQAEAAYVDSFASGELGLQNVTSVIGTSNSPMDLTKFVDLMVPEMQRRGLHRTAYEVSTFRENLRS